MPIKNEYSDAGKETFAIRDYHNLNQNEVQCCGNFWPIIQHVYT